MKNISELLKALAAAGYKTVRSLPREWFTNGKPKPIFDVVCVPGSLLDDKTRNFMALSVLDGKKVKYRELQVVAEALIVRGVELAADEPSQEK